MSDVKIKIFDFLNDLSYDKKGILVEDNESQYNSFMINRWLSMRIDTIMYAQEMNSLSHLPKQMQYDYYLHSLKKMKRKFDYVKHKRHEDIAAIQEYYNCSESKAKDILKLLRDVDVTYIKSKLYKGGTNT